MSSRQESVAVRSSLKGWLNDHMTLSRLFNSLDLSSLNDKMGILLLEGLNELIYRHTSFYYTTLCFTVLHRHHFFFFFFFQIENFCQLCVEKLTGTTFPTAFSHFMSLGHILVILAIFQTFSLLLYLWWWPVISDLWCSYYKKITTCWRLRWWFAFFSRVFF